MKRALIITLIFVLLLPALSLAANGLEEKLGNHWLKGELEEDFLPYYFPYLAKGNFERFEPDGEFSEDEFLLSFSSLLKDKGYPWSTIGWRKKLTRIEMVTILGEKLLSMDVIEASDGIMPFIDVDEGSGAKRQALADLYQAGIIKGQSENRFNPHAYITQAEAILVLQRINTLLDEIAKDDKDNQGKQPQLGAEEIPFTLSGSLQSYSGEEGIILKTKGDNMQVTISKSFPNPGYSMGVERVLRDGAGYKIKLTIAPPSKGSIQLQVITFKTITIEIDKEHLGDPPYKFTLEK